MNLVLLRWLEFGVVFVLLPTIAVIYRQQLSGWLLPILCAVSALCLWVVINDQGFKRFRLTNFAAIRPLVKSSVRFFVLCVLLSAVLLAAVNPDLLFQLPIQHPYHWLMLLAIYPLFSVIPQELIFRTYLFHRFKKVMPNKNVRIWISALVFALAHLIYANWVAVGLAFVGGLMFAHTYGQSRSTAACVLQHSVWGLWIFTLGAGQYLTLA